MRCARRGAPALALLVALSGPADRAAAGADDTPPPPTAEGETAPEATLTIRDELLVEDRVPYVADSATTATKSRTELRLLPVSVSSVSTALLADQNARILGEALENVAGVNSQTNAGVHDFFFIRGFDSLSSSAVTTDGALEPEATFYQTYNLERIEVVRGPAGFLYGGNALAGLVNLVSKRPASGAFTRVGLFAGSHATGYGTLDFNVGNAAGDRGFRLNAVWQESNGSRDGAASSVVGANPVYTFLAGERTAVTVSLETLRSDYTPDLGLPLVFGRQIPDVPRDRSYQTPFDASDQDILRFRVDVESRLGDGWTLHDLAYYHLLDWRTRGSLLNGAFPDATGALAVFRTRTVLDDHQAILGNQLDLRRSVRTGALTHDLTFGLELQRLGDDFTLDVGLLPSIDLFDPVETAPPDDVLLPGFGTAADTRTRVVAPYVLDDLHLARRWHLYLGGRLDDLDFADRVSSFRRRDREASPFLGVLYAASDALSLYANYAEAFSPPSTTVAGEGRRPEHGRQVEVGVKRDFRGGRLHTSLALYRLEKTDVAIVDDNGFTSQQGDQRSRGAELEVAGTAGRELYWILSYAFTDAELTRFTEAVVVSQNPFRQIVVDRSGNSAAFAPEHLAKLWISKRFPSGFGIAGGVRYVGSQFIAEDNVFRLDDSLVVDAHLSYNWARWQASLHLQNLTDEESFGRGFGSGSVLPADGFHVLGGVRFSL